VQPSSISRVSIGMFAGCPLMTWEKKTYVAPGTYYAKLSHPPRFETAWVKIVVSPDAERRVCKIGTELVKIKKKRKKD